jgi:hypothetical protein
VKIQGSLLLILAVALIGCIPGCLECDKQQLGETCSENPECCSGHCSEEGICCIGPGQTPSSHDPEDCCSGRLESGKCCATSGMVADDAGDCCSGLVYSSTSKRCLSPQEACEEQEGCRWIESSVVGGTRCDCPEGGGAVIVPPEERCRECASQRLCPDADHYYTYPNMVAMSTECIEDCEVPDYGPIWASSEERANECANQRMRELGCVNFPNPTTGMTCLRGDPVITY